MYRARRFDSRPVPGNTIWRARRVRVDGITVAVRVRHTLLFWRAFEVEASTLRGGAERAARMLAPAHARPWRERTADGVRSAV